MRLDLLKGTWVDDKKPTRNKSPEAAVKKSIEAYLKLKGGYVRQINSGGTLRAGKWHSSGQGSGISDLLAWLPNACMIAVEVKAPGKKRTATDEQHKFLREIISRGFNGCIADSVACVEACLAQTREQQLETLNNLKPVKRACSKEPLFP
jgi:hypothetical protein